MWSIDHHGFQLLECNLEISVGIDYHRSKSSPINYFEQNLITVSLLK